MSSKYEKVFTPIKIRGVEFQNRIECAPMSPKFADMHGNVTTEFINFFRAIARGRPGIVTIGNSAIDLAESQDETRHLDLSSDDRILGLGQFADMCESCGVIPSIEINHSGRDAWYDIRKNVPYGPSECYTKAELDKARKLGREPVKARAMDKERIARTVDKYSEAALRCKKAGFPMAMLHGAHGNLIAQFLSPMTNQRTDEYGGSLENRARFAIEVIDDVRRKCGEDFVIEFRISAEEFAPEGMHWQETLEFAKMIEDKIDILHVSAGMRADVAFTRYFMQPQHMPEMFNVHFAEKFKKELKVPICTVGSIMNLENAEMILENGWADFVAMARPFLADPQIVRKSACGREDDITPCLRCAYHARGGTKNKVIGCAVNPFCGNETQYPQGRVYPAAVKKNVAVVGGGPAGMQAAVTLAERGHSVTLIEKESKLGGNLLRAGTLPFKAGIRRYTKWMSEKVMKNESITVRLDTEATPELITEMKPDALVIAAGAEKLVPPIPGVEKSHVHWAPDADEGLCQVGENILIVGAGTIGLESGAYFSGQGKKVTLVEMAAEQSRLFPTLGTGAYFALKEMLDNNGAEVIMSHAVTEIGDTYAEIKDLNTGEKRRIECDTVLLAAGLKPRKETAEALRHCAPETEVFIVGDLKKPATIGDAVNAAFGIANII